MFQEGKKKGEGGGERAFNIRSTKITQTYQSSIA